VGDAEPDDVAPVTATHFPLDMPPSSPAPVRPRVEAAGEPESMSAEPAGPVPVPATPSPEDTPQSDTSDGCS